MAIKIFYLTTDTKIGGTEQMLLTLLNRLDKKRYSTFLCAIKPGGPLIEEAKKVGVRGECLLKEPKEPGGLLIEKIINRIFWFARFFLIPFKLASLIKREKPDILHTFLFHANILGRIVGKFTGVAIIISSQRSIDKWRKPWHSFLDRLTSSFCNLIISNSEAGRKILIQRDRIDPEKIITIHNGIDLKKFNIEIDIYEKKRELGLKHEDKVIGIIANLRRVKGHCYLFEAFQNAKCKMSLKDSILKLLVVGDGELKQELTGLAEKLKIKDSVIFTGFRDDIPEILQVIDIFVLPSLWEGFPVSILEAMASSRPVIASSVGGIPEAVIDQETGFLVPPQDVRSLEEALLKLVNDSGQAKRMGIAGRKRIEECFTLDKMIKKMEGVYNGYRQYF